MAGERYKYRRTAEEVSTKKKKKMLQILKELKAKMKEIDELAKGLETEKIKLSVSPKRSRKMLEEIRVPPLELLKNNSDKK